MAPSNPKVSIVIATYNMSSVLPYSVGSALGQSFADFELIVVGDGCTDDSAEVVRAIGDERLRWINLPANSGHQSTPNNKGIEAARGELIAYDEHQAPVAAPARAVIRPLSGVGQRIRAWLGEKPWRRPIPRSASSSRPTI